MASSATATKINRVLDLHDAYINRRPLKRASNANPFTFLLVLLLLFFHVFTFEAEDGGATCAGMEINNSYVNALSCATRKDRDAYYEATGNQTRSSWTRDASWNFSDSCCKLDGCTDSSPMDMDLNARRFSIIQPSPVNFLSRLRTICNCPSRIMCKHLGYQVVMIRVSFYLRVINGINKITVDDGSFEEILGFRLTFRSEKLHLLR